MGLDLRGDPLLSSAGLDHVRVQRPLDEEAHPQVFRAEVSELPRLLFEDADELLADDFPLLLGIRDAREPGQESLLCLDVHERDAEVAGERLDHLFGLVLAQ